MATNRDLAVLVFDGNLDEKELQTACEKYGVTTGTRSEMELRLLAKLKSLPPEDWALYYPEDGDDNIIDVPIKTVTPPVPSPDKKPTQALTEGEKMEEFLKGLTFGIWKRNKR